MALWDARGDASGESTWATDVTARSEMPPATRRLLHALLARAQTAGVEGDALSVKALLWRRRGDDVDRLEASVFARLARGDSAALAWIEARYATALRLLVTLTRAPGADVDDLLQEVRVKLWRSATRFDPARGSVAVWVLSVAHYELLDERRQLLRRRRRAPAEALLHPDADAAGDVGSDDADRVADAVAALDAPLQDVLRGAADDRSHPEIAASLGLPLGTVKSRLRRAQRLIRAALGLADAPG